MRKLFGVSALCLGIFIVAAGFTFHASPAHVATAAEAEALLSAPMNFREARVGCVACDICGDDGHLTISNPEALRSGLVHNCYDQYNNCDFWHPADCTVQEDVQEVDLAALWPTLTDGTTDEIRGILQRMPERVYLNVDRSSLQVLGCSGAVIANLPLAPESVAALAQD